MLNMFNCYYKMNSLKSQIAAARKELELTWAAIGRTDQQVLDAAEKVDKLINEYDRLVKEDKTLAMNNQEITAVNQFHQVTQFA